MSSDRGYLETLETCYPEELAAVREEAREKLIQAGTALINGVTTEVTVGHRAVYAVPFALLSDLTDAILDAEHESTAALIAQLAKLRRGGA